MAVEVRAALVIIGNEVLSGRTQDANLQFIALGLAEVGVRLKEVRVIPDEQSVIIDTVNLLRRQFDYVFTTGGIGPTHDDITSESIAKAFDVPLLRDPRAVERLLRQIKPENLNEARLRMANIPQGADLIDNPVSHAPGFRLGNVFVMAGVPRIMQAMFDGIKGDLRGGARLLAVEVTIAGGEGVIADGLGALQRQNAEVEIGSYPFNRDGGYGTVIVVRGRDGGQVAQTAQAVGHLAKACGLAATGQDQAPK